MKSFIYACPFCHQRITCDDSKCGTVMKCPTCYQRVVAPQTTGPSDGKFIMTGQKYVEKALPAMPDDMVASSGPNKFAMAAIGSLAMALVLGLGLYFFGGQIFGRADQWRLGSDWESSDIGNVQAPGAWKLAEGTFTIAGSGEDVWGLADSFRYVYQPMNGDGTVTVRITDVQNTDPWAKAGVMIRQTLAPDSAYAVLWATPTSGLAFQQRLRPGAAAIDVQLAPQIQAPCWLRLKRQGLTFSAFCSTDEKNWTPLNTTMIDMGKPVYVGLGVCAHQNGTLCQATFDRLEVTGK